MPLSKFNATCLILAMASASGYVIGSSPFPEVELAPLVSAFSVGDVGGDALAWLEVENRSDLAPIVFVTGVHCIEASGDESYHRLEFYLNSSNSEQRVVIYFTVVPGVSVFDSPTKASDLFLRRRVTQFHFWVEGPRPGGAGHVVAYSSREPLPSCGVVANYASKPTAGDMLQSFRPLPASGGLTRR